MKIDPMNYLTVELLTILYPLFLFKQNLFPFIMILVIIVHGLRLKKNIHQVNKEFLPNFQIFVLYIFLTFGLFYSKNFVLFGFLFGLLQYISYISHENISNNKYDWLKIWIDLPITIMSSYITYYGLKKNNLLLAPFMGDVVYHILEFLNKY
jgi:hypothetical protein